MNNLNDWSVYDVDGSGLFEEINLKRDNPQRVGDVTVHFNNHEKHLASYIANYPVAVGCVAWLTNEVVLKALAKCKAVSIIVQKEDFLRPDSNVGYQKEKLRSLYRKLPKGVSKDISDKDYFWGELFLNLYVCGSWETAPIRWMGQFNRDRNPAFPRMHHKFLVFCDIKENDHHQYYMSDHKRIVPQAVWTGSFNMTYNATQSLENALFIENREISQLYYAEWERTFALSEAINIDWDIFEWEPEEFRIGT